MPRAPGPVGAIVMLRVLRAPWPLRPLHPWNIESIGQKEVFDHPVGLGFPDISKACPIHDLQSVVILCDETNAGENSRVFAFYRSYANIPRKPFLVFSAVSVLFISHVNSLSFR